MVRNIKLTIQYDGTRYHGWQRQAGSASIQEVVEDSLEKMTGSRVSLIGSGRTDAGVHALAQVANFRTESQIPLEGFMRGLNSLLPNDIAIVSATDVPLDFHAIRDAVCKVYCYHIIVGATRVPVWETRSWTLSRPLDVGCMIQALRSLKGCHDFSAFQASGSRVKGSRRTVYHLEIESLDREIFPPSGARHYVLTIAADGFLRYMVRNIVGLLVEIGMGRRHPDEAAAVLASRNRAEAGPTAPPQGLYLRRVFYGNEECPFPTELPTR
jgi:tRNA pseudouridine38-40 synthase